jgi:hypothetical protein
MSVVLTLSSFYHPPLLLNSLQLLLVLSLFLSSHSPSHSVRSQVGSTKQAIGLTILWLSGVGWPSHSQSQAYQQLWYRAKWPLVLSRVTTLPCPSFQSPPPKKPTWEISSFRDYSSSYCNCKSPRLGVGLWSVRIESTHDSPSARLNLRKLYRTILGPWVAQQLAVAAQGFHP